MKKKPLLISLLFVVLVILAVVYLLKGDKVSAPTQTTTDQATTAESQETETIATTPSPQKGKYVEYSDQVIAETSGTKVLFFHAPWCPQCQKLDADIVEQGVPNDLTIIKVDYDTNQSLRQKYGVTIQTTTVLVNDSGDLVKKFVAYDDPSLSAVLTNLL